MSKTAPANYTFAPANKPIRTKVIVLGSSGAGKTSFIRRYFHKTFQDERRSTKCADFYSIIVPNPLAEAEGCLDKPGSALSKSTTKKKSSSAPSSREDGSVSAGTSTTRSARSTKSKKHKKKKHKKKKSSSESNEAKKGNASTKTNGTSTRTGAMDSSAHILENKYVSLQMWDTAGKERLLTESAGLTSRLGDAFFRHANVAILIYDATSSRSFLQLIKWYSELLERISRVQIEEGYGYENDPALSTDAHAHGAEYPFDGHGRGGSGTSTKSHSRTATNGSSDLSLMSKHRNVKRRFPVLVVATKLDRLKAEQSKSGNIRTVQQRNVLGLQSGFKGMDYHYEYTVYGNDIQNGGHDDEGNTRQSKSNTTGSNDNAAPSIGKSSSERMSLSYSLEGGSWAKDKEYMDYVRMAEDECFPDRTMVKRWCRRNGLQHVEVSALENMGIDFAVKTVVSLALKETIDQEKRKIQEDAMKHQLLKSKKENGHHGSGKDKILDHEDECKFCQFLLPNVLRR